MSVNDGGDAKRKEVCASRGLIENAFISFNAGWRDTINNNY